MPCRWLAGAGGGDSEGEAGFCCAQGRDLGAVATVLMRITERAWAAARLSSLSVS